MNGSLGWFSWHFDTIQFVLKTQSVEKVRYLFCIQVCVCVCVCVPVYVLIYSEHFRLCFLGHRFGMPNHHETTSVDDGFNVHWHGWLGDVCQKKFEACKEDKAFHKLSPLNIDPRSII